MWSIIKLHDLVYLAEPPWRGMAEASSSGSPRDESMEPEEAMGNQGEKDAQASARLEQANLGLG